MNKKYLLYIPAAALCATLAILLTQNKNSVLVEVDTQSNPLDAAHIKNKLDLAETSPKKQDNVISQNSLESVTSSKLSNEQLDINKNDNNQLEAQPSPDNNISPIADSEFVERNESLAFPNTSMLSIEEISQSSELYQEKIELPTVEQSDSEAIDGENIKPTQLTDVEQETHRYEMEDLIEQEKMAKQQLSYNVSNNIDNLPTDENLPHMVK